MRHLDKSSAARQIRMTGKTGSASASNTSGLRSLVAGLEILEYVSKCTAPPTATAISAALNLSRSAVYRSLLVLEDRGYITRDGDGGYVQSGGPDRQLPAAPSLQHLLSHARPAMQSLCDTISQSCNLAVPSLPDLQVIARQESPGPFGINVPLGFRYDVPASAPGLAFAAFAHPWDPARWPDESNAVIDAHHWSALKKAVQRTAEAGFAQVENPYMPDVVDLSCPIFEKASFVAALTVPYIKTSGGANLTWCLAALQQAAEELNLSLQRDALAA